jgi:hypothetical protein
MTCRKMEVIFCDEVRHGSGKDKTSPVRRVTQYWSLDGQLLAEIDPCSKVVQIEDDPEQQKADYSFGGMVWKPSQRQSEEKK